MSASIVVGQSVAFTSTVSGGYPPYNYQWYLNDVAVSGATSTVGLSRLLQVAYITCS